MSEVNEALKLIAQAKAEILRFNQETLFEKDIYLELAVQYLDEAIEKLSK